MLGQLITTYPGFEVEKYGIPRQVTSSLTVHEIASRAFFRATAGGTRCWDPAYFLNGRFDRAASHRIRRGAGLFIGWSGSALESMRRAKDLGAITVVERGSSHIGYQSAILDEEYKKYGLAPKKTDSRVIEQELQEYGLADYISVLSTFARDTFIKNGISADKIITESLGVDPAEFTPAKKQDTVFRIIFCGVIALRKGVQYLLQAFDELRLPRAELWLIGSLDQTMSPVLDKYRRENIILKGSVPQARLPGLYSQGSVFCLPSIEDGFGMVIPQAMACALPAICSVNTGAPDLIRDGVDGFIIPIRDVGRLKEKILFMYENQELAAAMGREAHARVREHFTWDAYGARIAAQYARVRGAAA